MRWVHSYFADEDTDFYFEIGDDGGVLRQVEIERASGRVDAAASLTEWEAAFAEDRHLDYQRQYGGVGEGNANDWEPGWEDEHLDAESFEGVWLSARAALGK